MTSFRSRISASLLGGLATLSFSTIALAQDAGASASPAAEESPAATAEGAMPTSSLGLEQVVQAGDANQPLKGKALKKAITRIAPTIADHEIASAGEDAATRVIELVLAARSARSDGDEASAKVLRALAGIAYRAGWAAAGIDSVAFNDSIRAVVAEDYAGVEGLALDPPEGFTDVCLQRRAQYVFPAHAPWECYAGDPKARFVRVSSELVDESAAGTTDLYAGPREGADTAISIDEVAYAKGMDGALKGKPLRKALEKVAPAVVRSRLGAPGQSVEERVVAAVLEARAADEAGAKKAAKALMGLARIAYRSGWTSQGSDAVHMNSALVTLVEDEYAGIEGLEVFPPEGWTDICLQARKRGPDYVVDSTAPWECNAAKGRLLRVPVTDIDESKNGTDELYLGDE